MSKKTAVLIIDDEKDLVQILMSMIEDCADEIIPAYNGMEGIQILKERGDQVSCIVCDIKMPKMNGIEVIKKVREMKLNTPFIFYTGHGNEDHMKEALKYGAFDFLYKPCENLDQVVFKAIEEWKKSGTLKNEVENAFDQVLDKKNKAE